jgi:DNA-binding protein HU-beta
MGEGINLAVVSNELYLRVDQGDSSLPKLTKSGCYDLVKGVFDIIGQAMAEGEEVAVPQFGKFIPVAKPARNARNPKTGETIKVPAKTVPKFRASSALRLKVEKAKVKTASKKKTVPKKKTASKKKTKK